MAKMSKVLRGVPVQLRSVITGHLSGDSLTRIYLRVSSHGGQREMVGALVSALRPTS
jgi:hypothetical protein